MSAYRQRGFTLVELMIAVAIVAILASIALPSYRAYVMRSRVPAAFDALSSYSSRMEQTYQDTGRYDTAASAGVCLPTLPTASNFTLSCATANAGQTYLVTATGTGSMVGYAYTLTNTGTRATTAHPNGANATCWSLKGTSCDS
ncbi:type IV pilin protein [Aquabacterium sp.]|uniref:type IV pilin protein n=1 Tax=Aquabacterium sp. TaxID=1872578 RepID=UPI002C0DB9B3|nr:type IV pilin protein [Aquabacterium sp.]HSW07798.1 type IV pilin protein [Aquabacterium sp.]